jgi:hypothetical protein
MHGFWRERSFVAALLLGACGVFPASGQTLSNSKLSAHLINGYTVGSSNIVAGKPRVLKVLALDSGFPSGLVQAMRDYKAKAPGGKVVVRVYSPKNYSLANDPTASALDFWNTVIQPPLNGISAADRALIDYLEGPNEGETPTLGYPRSPQGAQWFNQFWTNLTPLIVAAGYKPCVGSIAVGNPGSFSDLDPFVPALRQAKAAGGAWSYHAYTIQYSTDVGVEVWYSLRYRQFYSYFSQQGYSDLLNLPLILTEGGVDATGDPNTSGWQYRGTAAQYERWLNWFDGQMSQDSYLLGCTLFENGDPTGWSSFELEPIAGWMKTYLTNPTTWPPPPTGFTAAVSAGSVVLAWTNAPLNPVTYAVKRSLTSGGPYTLLARGITEGLPVTTFTDTSPVSGVTNYYVVTALNTVAESDNSAEVAVGLGLWPTLPGTPSGLTATVGSGNITLNWSSPANAASFKVRRSTTSGSGYTVIASNGLSAPFLDTSYTVGTPYYYVVSAVNNMGESPISNQAAATPTSALPDVVVTAITWTPATIYPGSQVYFTATVKNQGSAPAPGNGTSIGVGFSVDGVGGFWSGGYTGPLAPGASVNLTANGGSSVPFWVATAGAHEVTAIVDDIDRFPEGNEGNNLRSVPFSTSGSNYAFNCGGPAVGGFVADAAYTSSLSTNTVTNRISTTGVSNPAPQAVYQTERWRSFTCLVPQLTPSKLYKARLHFAEISPFVSAVGDRQFNVTLNGAQVLTNFDLLAVAGAKFRAVTRPFNVTTDSAGQIALQFSKGAAGEPTCSGIEIFAYTNAAPALTAIPNKTVNAGATLVFTNTATDADLPADTLAFTLPLKPVGATLTPDGVFSWTAPAVLAPQTNSVSVRVTDNGTPPLSDAKLFTITVVPPPRLSSVTLTNGVMNFTWNTYPGETYRMVYKPDLNAPAWTPVGPDTVAAGYLLSGSDTNLVGQQRFYRVMQVVWP